MKDPIKLLKLGWKTGMTAMIVVTMLVGGLALNLNSALATNPNLTINYLVAHNDVGSWGDSVNVGVGETITLYAEIHNTNVPTTANNVKIKANLPSTTGTSTATASADNAASVSDNVQINVNGGNLEYVAGSALMTWDVNGDGNFEFDNTQISDQIVGSGVTLGNQQGCNQYIIQISFLARVVGGPQPSPTPTPTPQPSPTPPVCTDCGGDENNNNNDNNNENNNNNNQDQEQNHDVDVNVSQNNNQTVNITSPAPPAVAGVKVPLKQPETGVSVLGTSLMAGAAPVGFSLFPLCR